MLRLGIDGHGDHSTKLFADHKLCYDGQWPLTCHYFKHCLKLFTTNTYCENNKKISFIYAAGTFCIHLVPNVGLDYSPKNQNRQVEWRLGFSRGIEETTCGNSRCQLNEKWSFQGWYRKIHEQIPWVLVFGLGIS